MPATPARLPLSPARIVASAIHIADTDGWNSVSMRRIAAELGVAPMAFYKHISDKEALDAAMIDAVVTSYASPTPGETGVPAARARILAARSALLRHPWLRAAIEAAPQATPATLHHMNAVAGDLMAAGGNYDLVHYVMHALGHRIWGFSPEAFPRTPADAPPDPDHAAALAAMFPHIVGIAQDAATRNTSHACEEDGEFTFALDLLLDSFVRLRDTGWESRPVTA